IPLLSLLLIAASGCGATTVPERSAAIEQEFLTRHKSVRTVDMSALLLRLDRGMEEYVSKVRKSENDRARREAQSLEKWLEQQAIRHKTKLFEKLSDPSARNRGIAAAALGFTRHEDLVAPLQSLLDDDAPFVRVNACFGLATIAAPITPLTRLNEILLDPTEALPVRQSAGWALLSLQRSGSPRENFRRIWRNALAGDPLSKDPILLIHGLRGLGMLREAQQLDAIAPYVSHPKAKVRMTALIAAARTGNRDAAPYIFPLLSAREVNANVRLAARKALKALTGNRVDHEYDLPSWKKEFSR
ncbi:MAG: HEAT repeat domain-containing protein, partial [Planctomycetota bacterium]